MITLRRLLTLLVCAALWIPAAQAQDAASVHWSLTEADGLAVTAETGVATGAAVRAGTMEVRDYTGTLSDDSEGPLGPYQRWWLGGAEWPVESAPDPGRYVEFAVAPAAGATFDVTDITLVLNAGGTGEMKANLFYDRDPGFTAPTLLQGDVAVSRDAVERFAFTIAETLEDGDSLYVRVYPWLGGGNASATRYVFLQDVTVLGTGTAGEPAPPQGVYWALTEDDTTAVTAAAEGLAGTPAMGEGIAVRDYTGDLSDDSVGPLGPFQRWWLADLWPDETAPNADRYIQFAATAADGLDFAADSISLVLNAAGTGNMMASLYWSTDPTFADSTALEENVAVSRDELGSYSYDLDVTVPDGDTLFFRVYPYLDGGSTSEGKYVLLQAVTLAGRAVTPELEVEGVYWALTEADTFAVSAAGENLGGAPAEGVGIMVRNYADDSDPGPGPLGAIQRWWLDDVWPDETAPNADRYIEFAAAPDAAYAFAVDSVTIWLGSHGTSNMMASLYYSTDPTFADSTALEENLNVGRSTFDRYVYPLDVDVLEGDSIYVRVYPYLDGGSTSAGKYLLMQAVTVAGTAIDPMSVGTEQGPVAATFTLGAAYPNPTASRATVRYEVGVAGDVRIDVYNVLGQRVGTLVDGPKAPGAYAAAVDAAALAPGVYFVRMQAGGQARTQRLVVAR